MIVRPVPEPEKRASIPREFAASAAVKEPRTVSRAWMVSEPAPALCALMPVRAAVTLPRATIVRSAPEVAEATIPSERASLRDSGDGRKTRPSKTMLSEPEPALDAWMPAPVPRNTMPGVPRVTLRSPPLPSALMPSPPASPTSMRPRTLTARSPVPEFLTRIPPFPDLTSPAVTVRSVPDVPA